MENIPKISPKQIECYDKFNQLLKEGDYVDVQKDGVHQIYLKEDNQLYFKPYGKEDRVCSYFSNDMVKCDIDGNWLTDDICEKISEPKKETVEEAAENFLKHGAKECKTAKQVLIEFAKWHEQKMYSEEEVLMILNDYDREFKINTFAYTKPCSLVEEWFSKIKK